MYKLLFHPQAVKKLRRLHPNDRKRILQKIDKLAQNPESKEPDTKKLVKTKNSFRLRSGDIRTIFEINEREKVIYVWDVDYRGNIY